MHQEGKREAHLRDSASACSCSSRTSPPAWISFSACSPSTSLACSSDTRGQLPRSWTPPPPAPGRAAAAQLGASATQQGGWQRAAARCCAPALAAQAVAAALAAWRPHLVGSFLLQVSPLGVQLLQGRCQLLQIRLAIVQRPVPTMRPRVSSAAGAACARLGQLPCRCTAPAASGTGHAHALWTGPCCSAMQRPAAHRWQVVYSNAMHSRLRRSWC
jgi:hypothetical protein